MLPPIRRRPAAPLLAVHGAQVARARRPIRPRSSLCARAGIGRWCRPGETTAARR